MSCICGAAEHEATMERDMVETTKGGALPGVIPDQFRQFVPGMWTFTIDGKRVSEGDYRKFLREHIPA